MDRNCLWFIPIIPPIKAFIPAINIIRELRDCLVKKTRIVSGASFCQDERIVQETQEIEDITEGYQK